MRGCRYWPKRYKASLDVSCRVTCSRGHADAWACERGCSVGESIERAVGRGRGHCTLARARTHGRTHSSSTPCTHTRASRKRPPAKSAISQNPQLTGVAKSHSCADNDTDIDAEDLASSRFAPLFWVMRALTREISRGG